MASRVLHSPRILYLMRWEEIRCARHNSNRICCCSRWLTAYPKPSHGPSPALILQEMETDPSKQVRLGFITGLVPKAKAATFERILFRATRGNMFLRQEDVEEPVTDPASGEKVEKVVFVVFFAGERAKVKITKICEAFGANRYPFPEDPIKQRQMHAEVRERGGAPCSGLIGNRVGLHEEICSSLCPCVHLMKGRR